MQYQNDLATEKAAAWADIKSSQRSGNVLTAQAIGIEYFESAKQECLKLNYNGIYGYLPKAFIDEYDFKGIQNFVGKYFEFVAHTVDMENQIFIANRIEALKTLSKRFWRQAKLGDTYAAFVRGVDQFNVYLLVNGVPTKLHRSDYSYTFYDDLREEVFIGDTIEVKITELIKPDAAAAADDVQAEENPNPEGSLLVSKKALEVDPMIFLNEYQEKATYLGTITKVHLDHGLFIRLEPRGIMVRSGFPPGGNSSRLKEGEQVNFKIQEINAKERRVKGIVITPNQGFRAKTTRGINYGR
ncbi:MULTISPECIES: hypothetical protein [Bacillus]|uniref:hypothetical protein n=1 Tax=Bacillus TaxID=1386 RepID=UPI000C7651C0|nr:MULTISPECIES: hypothetical protein [Bacillus]MCP1161420.1 30S ribosomal protein S1 [Bacillus infantis]PLR70512.1 30S ribosomal protein S1 [Bacillus sp. UMB0728]